MDLKDRRRSLQLAGFHYALKCLVSKAKKQPLTSENCGNFLADLEELLMKAAREDEFREKE
jgi:hypothetical protein